MILSNQMGAFIHTSSTQNAFSNGTTQQNARIKYILLIQYNDMYLCTKEILFQRVRMVTHVTSLMQTTQLDLQIFVN